jgi:arginase
MPLACCIGQGPPELTHLFDFAPKVDPRNVAIIGLRDVDRTEVPQVREAGVTAYTMRDIDERGLRTVMLEAIEHASDGTPASTYRLTWIPWTRERRPAWAHPYAAA